MIDDYVRVRKQVEEYAEKLRGIALAPKRWVILIKSDEEGQDAFLHGNIKMDEAVLGLLMGLEKGGEVCPAEVVSRALEAVEGYGKHTRSLVVVEETPPKCPSCGSTNIQALEEGKCPECAANLSYDVSTYLSPSFSKGRIGFGVTCPKCGWKGTEVHETWFLRYDWKEEKRE